MAKAQPVSLLRGLLAAIVLIAAAPFILLALGIYLVVGILLHVAAWSVWCTRGRDVLLVYSNSPIWQSYVEEQLLPRLGQRAVVLNWSQRRVWRRTLSVAAFRFFGGGREYNPMAVVFRPFRLARRFRFYRAFRDFKHGQPEAVDNLTKELFELLEGHRGQAA